MKRLFDIIFAALGIMLLSPIIAAGALVVKLASPGPVFYRQKRVGRGGQTFTIYKLRTMRVEDGGSSVATPGDSRIFPMGHVLRRTKIDELPQLFSVLVGNMSFVGPRPEVPTFVAHYQPHWRRVLDIRPGITGIGSLLFRKEEILFSAGQNREIWYINEILPRKMALELEYLKHASLALDLRLIILTLISLFYRPSALPLKCFARSWERSLKNYRAMGSQASSPQNKSETNKI